MPGFDGTGPGGWGAMTGWGSGYCYAPGRIGRPRYGFGGGFGRGRGYRHRFWLTGGPGWAYRTDYPAMTREEEM
ncbi:MAG: DUF5320 domain-containing protein, partial [Calditrichaeota bacterium]|nr:DUF5320 domain-containing protein [Calditrichota bacterium]